MYSGRMHRAHLLCLLFTVAAACGDEPAPGSTEPDLTWTPRQDLGSGFPDVPPIHFIAVGDTGKGNKGQFDVAAAMKAKCEASGCDFVLLLGDNIYESGASSVSDPLFQELFEVPYADLDLPFWVSLGNHDYGNGGVGNEFDKPENEIAYSAVSTKWQLPARTYQFASGAAAFFALDTNASMWSMDGDNGAKLDSFIAATTAPWKIAFGHHPYKSNGSHGNAGAYEGLSPDVPIFPGVPVKDFLESHVCGKVDLYLSGHDHNRQWLEETCDGTELAVSGAGATTTALVGGNPVRFQRDTLGFLYVTVDAHTLSADFIDTSGDIEFTRTLTR